ncbi:MAG TPA: hypothetical protein PKD00_04700 [Burkholderiales bacterium]|nr:hypothetical protein [Burkholderiales bacterium]
MKYNSNKTLDILDLICSTKTKSLNTLINTLFCETEKPTKNSSKSNFAGIIPADVISNLSVNNSDFGSIS